jgi:DUF4097 and DUF4098 domain-containing protein YvlB
MTDRQGSATVAVPRRRHAARVGALLFAASLAGAALLGTSGCSEFEQHQATNSYQVPGVVSALVTQGHNGSVRVVGDATGATEVTETLTYRDSKPVTTHLLAGGTLTLAYQSCGDCGVAYVVHVPHDVAVTVTNDSGAVDVSDVNGAVAVTDHSGLVSVANVTGAVRASTDSGAVQLSAIDGDLDASATSGAVRAAGLRGQQVELGTASGAVDAGFAAAPLRLTASAESGSIRLRLPSGVSYQVHATATSGSVHVGVPTDPNAADQVTARSESGSITINGG